MQFSLGSLFGGGSSQSAAAPATQAASTGGEGGGQQASATQGQQPAQAAQPGQQAAAKPEGLDYLRELFDNKPANGQGKQAPRLQLTAEQIGGVAQKHDFSSAVPQEALQKLQSGDMSALGDILNSVGRQIYQQAMQDATYLTDHYVDSRVGHENESFDARVARSMSTSNIQGINDLHPVAQNMLKQTISQMREFNPQASQSELEAQAWQMLQSLGSQFDREGRAKQQRAQQAEPDWDEYGGFAKDAN